MRDYHFTPESHLPMMREAVPGYDRSQDDGSPQLLDDQRFARGVRPRSPA